MLTPQTGPVFFENRRPTSSASLAIPSGATSSAAELSRRTKDFLDHKFDLLIRTIVNSRVYQTSFRTNDWNADDETNFSHAVPRRLSAEQLFDSIYVATDFPDSNVRRGGFLDLFGRPERQTSCECERRTDVSRVQVRNLLNGGTMADPKRRIAKPILNGATDRAIVEELYLAAWSTICSRPRAVSADARSFRWLERFDAVFSNTTASQSLARRSSIALCLLKAKPACGSASAGSSSRRSRRMRSTGSKPS